MGRVSESQWLCVWGCLLHPPQKRCLASMDIGSVLHWRLSSPVPHTLFSQSFQADQGLTGGCVDPRVRVLLAFRHSQY